MIAVRDEFAEAFREVVADGFRKNPHRKLEIVAMIHDARRGGQLDAADFFSELLHQIECDNIVLPGEYRGHRFHELGLS
jgi:hypothetical protein